MNRNSLAHYWKKLHNESFALFFHINQHRATNLIYPIILMIWAFISLLSSAIPSTTNPEKYTPPEKVILYVIRNLNLISLSERHDFSTDFILLVFVGYYLVLAIMYTVIAIYYKNETTPMIYKVCLWVVAQLHELYFWLLFPWDMQVHSKVAIVEFSHWSFSILALLTFIIPVLYVIWIRYTDIEINYTGRIPTSAPYSNFYWIYIGGVTFLSINEELVTTIHSEAFELVLNMILGIVLSGVNFKEFGFTCNSMRKIVGAILAEYTYFCFWIILKFHTDIEFNLALLLYIGFLLIPKAYAHLANKIEFSLLAGSKYSMLNLDQFNFLIRTILASLQGTGSEIVKDSLNLILFVQNHMASCKKATCPCMIDELIPHSVHAYKNSGLSKTFWQKTYRKPICEIIEDMFFEKANSAKDSSERLRYLISATMFLSSQTKNHMQAYVKLTFILHNRNNYRTRFIIGRIHEILEKKISETAKGYQSQIKLSSAITFYEYLQEAVIVSLEILGDYCELFDLLRHHMVDLDLIVKGSAIVNAKKKRLCRLLIDLCHINANNSELLKIIDQISLLNIIERDQLRILQKLLTSEDTLANKIRYHKELPDIFYDDAIVLFVSLSDTKLGVIKKITPNVTEVLGYQLQEVSNMRINQLMPGPFAAKHDKFMLNFLERGNSQRLNRYLQVYVLDRQSFIHHADLYLRLEPMGSELMIGGYMKPRQDTLCSIMLDENGGILNYDPKFHKALGYSIKSEKPLYDANICTIMPFLYPFFLRFPEDAIKDMFNFASLRENLELGEDTLLFNEKGFIAVPKKESIITLLKSKTKNLVHSSKTRSTEGTFLRTLSSIYSEFDTDEVDLFCVQFNYKKNIERSQEIHVAIIEIEEMRRINNSHIIKDCLRKTSQFIMKIHNYYRELNGLAPGETIQSYTREETFLRDRMIRSESGVSSPQTAIVSEITKGQKLRALSKLLLGIELKANDEELGKSLDDESKTGENSLLNILVRTPKEAMIHSFRGILRLIHSQNLNRSDFFSIRKSNSSLDNSFLPGTIVSRKSDEEEILEFNPEFSTNPMVKQQNLEYAVQENMKLLEQQTTGKKVLFQRTVLENNSEVTNTQQKHRIKSRFALQVSLPPETENYEKSHINKLKTYSETSEFENKFLLSPSRTDKGPSGELKKQKGVTSSMEVLGIYDQDLIVKQAQLGSDNAPEFNSGRKVKKQIFRKVKSSENTSLISNNHRYLKKLLHERHFAKCLHSVNMYGTLVFVVTITFISTMFVLYIPALSSIDQFIEHADFTNRMLGSYANFAARLELDIMINEGIFNDSSHVTTIEQDTVDLFKLGYESYKYAYLDSLLNANMESFSREISLRDVTFDIAGLGIDSLETVTLNFTYATSRVIKLMHDIMQSPSSTFTRNNEIVKYFRANFYEYSTKLNDIARTLFSEIETRGPQDSLKRTMEILLFVSLGTIGALALLMIPIFRYIEKEQEIGLSKMTTIPTKELDSKIIFFQKARSYLEGTLKLSHAIKASVSKSGLTSGVKLQDKNHKNVNQNRVFRTWRKEKARFWVIFIFLGIGFGPFLIYFAVVGDKIIIHLKHFQPIIEEMDIVIDSHAYFNSYYYLAYHTLNEWNTPAADKGVYLQQNMEFLGTIQDNAKTLITFLSSQLEENLKIGESFSPEYKSKTPLFIKSDVCEFIADGFLEGETKEDCENNLKGVAQLGLPIMLEKIYDLLNNIIEHMKESNYDITEAQALVNNSEFDQLDQLMIYGDQILSEYGRLVRENLLHIVKLQDTELIIDLVVGIVMALVFYFFGWKYFIRKSDDALHLVKETMAVLPFDIMIHNNYMIKYLKDNSAIVTK